MSQQGLQQASIRAITGTALDYNGDWHALFDSAGIAAGDFNGRLLAWINLKLGTSYPDVNGAMAALAASNGATSFQATGTFEAGSARYIGIIAAGQSNEVNFDTNGTINPALDLTDPRILQYTHDGGMVTVGGVPTGRPADARKLLPAAHPLRWPANHQTANWETLWGPSPALHFAYNLLPHIDANDRLVILPMAVGGVSLTNGPWAAGTGQLYNATISTLTQFLAEVPGSELGYILWTQGENESANGRTVTEAEYASAFDAVIGGIREVGPKAASASVIVHSMVPEWSANGIATGGNQAPIEAAHRMTPARLARSWFVQGATGAFRPGDTIHYNAAGARESGRRRAVAARFPALVTNGATLTAPTNLRHLGANRIAWDTPASGACLYEISHGPQGGAWTTLPFSPRAFTVPGETVKFDVPGATGSHEIQIATWYGATKVPSPILSFDAGTAPEPWVELDFDAATIASGKIVSVPSVGVNRQPWTAPVGREPTVATINGQRVAATTPSQTLEGPPIPVGPYSILTIVRHDNFNDFGSYVTGTDTYVTHQLARAGGGSTRAFAGHDGTTDGVQGPVMTVGADYMIMSILDPAAPAAARLRLVVNKVDYGFNGAGKAVDTAFNTTAGTRLNGLGNTGGLGNNAKYRSRQTIWTSALTLQQAIAEMEKRRVALGLTLG